MSDMTPEEWATVKSALVSGGLEACINNLLRSRAQQGIPHIDGLSPESIYTIYQAFDDGDGTPVEIRRSAFAHGYFTGWVDGSEVVEFTEIDGTLYSICDLSYGARVNVLIGNEINENVVGPVFDTAAEARAYVKGLTEK